MWWRVRWRLTDRPFATRLGNGARVRVPRGASGAGIYYRGWSEPELTSFLEHHLEPGDVMLDVGAHIGEFTLLAASRGATVHAFEPDPANAALLRANVARNRLAAVTVHEAAVSEHRGEMRFLAHDNPTLSALWTDEPAGGQAAEIVVAVTTLDALALPRVDVIKIDTEGAELGVLRGATTLLQRCSPTIVFEFAPAQYARFGTTPRQILDELAGHGYRITDLAGTPFTSWPDDLGWTNLAATKT